MQAYRVETEVQQNGTLTIQNLPLCAGETVEVIILVRPPTNQTSRYSLRGLPVEYRQPTEPVVVFTTTIRGEVDLAIVPTNDLLEQSS